MAVSFEMFLLEVDLALVRLCGMDRDMLPDWCYYDDFAEGYTSAQCAKRAMRNAQLCV